MLVYPSNSYVESHNPQCDGIWKWGFGEVVRVRLGHSGLFMMGLVPFKKRKTNSLSLCTHNEKRPHEYTVRRWLSTSQAEDSHKEPNLQIPWSDTSQPPELWEISVRCLNHLLYGTLLQQPELNRTHPKTWHPILADFNKDLTTSLDRYIPR